MDAVERLNRFKEESKIRERKHELYTGKRWLASVDQRSVIVEKTTVILQLKYCRTRVSLATEQVAVMTSTPFSLEAET